MELGAPLLVIESLIQTDKCCLFTNKQIHKYKTHRETVNQVHFFLFMLLVAYPGVFDPSYQSTSSAYRSYQSSFPLFPFDFPLPPLSFSFVYNNICDEFYQIL